MNRFEVHDNTVLDRQTGLMWTKSASLSDFPQTWHEAFDFIKELNESEFCGYADWKLPNRRELFSIVSLKETNPSLPSGHPFDHVFTSYYWTSTTCARLPDQAWYIHFGGARVFKGMKHNSYMLWPTRIADNRGSRILKTGQRRCYGESGHLVDCSGTGQDGEFRSGKQIATPPRFIESDGTVTDTLTNLTWLKNANAGNAMYDWSAAVDEVEKMNGKSRYGFGDWRVPDISELESLMDMDRHSPALPEGSPFLNVQEYYWSRTTSQYDGRYAWVLYMTDGAVGVGYKPLSEFYLWPVRGRADILSSGAISCQGL